MERELESLRERLALVEGWRKRRKEVERELSKVWVAAGDESMEGGGNELPPPEYVEKEGGDTA